MFQDPAFNALDIEFLRKRGFTVVEDPRDALASVPHTTFVFLLQAVFGAIECTIRTVKPPLPVSSDLHGILRYRDPKLLSLHSSIAPFLSQRVVVPLPHSKIIYHWGTHTIYYKLNSDVWKGDAGVIKPKAASET